MSGRGEVKLLESIERSKDRLLAWPVTCDISDWLVGRVVDFAPQWSELECEESFDYQSKGRKPECDTAVLIGFAHRTEDPLGTIREFVSRVKAKQYVVHLLVRMHPKTPNEETWTLVEPVDALKFRVEIEPAEIRATDLRKRQPTEWYLRIEGKEAEGLKELVPDPKSEAPVVESSQDVVEDTDVPVWDMVEE